MIRSATSSVLASSRRLTSQATITSTPTSKMPALQSLLLTAAVTAQLAFLTTESSDSTARATPAIVLRRVQALFPSGTQTERPTALVEPRQSLHMKARSTRTSQTIRTKSQAFKTLTTSTRLRTRTIPSCPTSTQTTTLALSTSATPIQLIMCHSWTHLTQFFSATTEIPARTTCLVVPTSTTTSSMMLSTSLVLLTTRPQATCSVFCKISHSLVHRLQTTLRLVAISWPRWTRPGTVEMMTTVFPLRCNKTLHQRQPPRRTAQASLSAATTYGTFPPVSRHI